jgi:hypothetical protein
VFISVSSQSILTVLIVSEVLYISLLIATTPAEFCLAVESWWTSVWGRGRHWPYLSEL